MDFSYLFEPYDRQVSLADKSFERIAGEFPDCIRCKPGCADCCHAVFGLFLIEAVFLKNDFDQLGEKEKAASLKRGLAAEKDLKTLERTLREFKDDPRRGSDVPYSAMTMPASSTRTAPLPAGFTASPPWFRGFRGFVVPRASKRIRRIPSLT